MLVHILRSLIGGITDGAFQKALGKYLRNRLAVTVVKDNIAQKRWNGLFIGRLMNKK